MTFSLTEVDVSWQPFFSDHLEELDEILESLQLEGTVPNRESIFRAFKAPLSEVKVLILGQDPYPGEGVADGLAFSSAREKIPASLRNIFIEYSSDLGLPAPMSPDLSKWSERGVLLLNRTLTTTVGERNAHVSIGWKNFTYSVAEFLAQHDVIAILWGNGARELADLFDKKIESVHPSPLSARRGFFGSRPFSRANELLKSSGREPIDWQI